MSDEQVSELRYIEELEAEVERQRVALSAAGMEKNALLAEKMAENEKLRGENDLLDKPLSVATAERDDWCRRTHGAEAGVEKLQRSTVHALYQGQKKRAEAAEAKLAEVEKAFSDHDEWLGEALAALGVKTVFDVKSRAVSIQRARELAEKLLPEDTELDIDSTLEAIVRLLSGKNE